MEKNFKHYPDQISPLYVMIAVLFVCFLMISNIIVNRLVSFSGIVLNGDLFLFSFTYIFGDILTEVYGFKRSRLVIWMGFLANIIMAAYFTLILQLPFPAEFTDNNAFKTVLSATPLIVLASITAYIVGEFSNSVTLSVLKKKTKGKYLWLRTIASTLIGQIGDTVTFMVIAFHWLPLPVLIQLIVVAYLFKVSYEILATPLTYVLIKRIKRYEKLDTYDYGESYNPFSVSLDKKDK